MKTEYDHRADAAYFAFWSGHDRVDIYGINS